VGVAMGDEQGNDGEGPGGHKVEQSRSVAARSVVDESERARACAH
jgi:hypothetical protein